MRKESVGGVSGDGSWRTWKETEDFKRRGGGQGGGIRPPVYLNYTVNNHAAEITNRNPPPLPSLPTLPHAPPLVLFPIPLSSSFPHPLQPPPPPGPSDIVFH